MIEIVVESTVRQGFPRSRGRDLPPLAGGSVQSERTEAGQVDRGGQQGEVGGDFADAAHSGATPTVAAAHQVTDLAFHFRPPDFRS
jgi:hypothetical protein